VAVTLPSPRPRVRFTTTDVRRMLEAGILAAEPRSELLDGELVVMSAENPAHIRTARHLVRLLRRSLGLRDDPDEDPQVYEGHTVELPPHWLPAPDVTVVVGPDERYAERWPEPDDILLAIEICDATLEDDRRLKLPGYARAGLRMVWLVDVRGRHIFVHTAPGQAGYAREQVYGSGQLVPLWLPTLPRLAVDDIFPAAGSA
jgi:Uma2 family endonuclease